MSRYRSFLAFTLVFCFLLSGCALGDASDGGTAERKTAGDEDPGLEQTTTPASGTEEAGHVSPETAPTVSPAPEETGDQDADNDGHQPDSSPHPVITGFGLVIGGMLEGEWAGADAFNQHIVGDEIYRFVSLEGQYLGDGIGSRKGELPFIHTLHGDYRPALGISGDWEVLPRPVSFSTDPADDLLEQMEGYLQAKAPSHRDIDILEAYEADIEGDGVAEHILYAASFHAIGMASGEGDYSVILIMRSDKGHVSLTPIVEYYSGNRLYEIQGLADMDGDGEYELAIHCEELMGEDSRGIVTLYDWNAGEFVGTRASQSFAYLDTDLYLSLDDAKKFLTPYGGRLIQEDNAQIDGSDVTVLSYEGAAGRQRKACILYLDGNGMVRLETQFMQAGFYETEEETLLWAVDSGLFAFYRLDSLGVSFSRPVYVMRVEDDAFAPPVSSVSFAEPGGSGHDNIVYTAFYENNIQKQTIIYTITRNGETFKLTEREVVYPDGGFAYPGTVEDLITAYIQSICLGLEDETVEMITREDLMDFRYVHPDDAMWKYFHYHEESGDHLDIRRISGDDVSALYRVEPTSSWAKDRQLALFVTVISWDGLLKVDEAIMDND